MRKIRIFAHLSLDGVISPGGPNEDSDYAHGGWTAPYRTPAGGALVAEAQGKGFDLLLGRRTYDLWAGAEHVGFEGEGADLSVVADHDAVGRSTSWRAPSARTTRAVPGASPAERAVIEGSNWATTACVPASVRRSSRVPRKRVAR